MIKYLYLISILWVISVTNSQAQTYIRDFTYHASEIDNEITSRTIALDQIKLVLLQEIGTHIRQKITITKDGTGNTFISENIEAITAGFTKIKILEEKWNGKTYYLKAKIKTNANQVLNALNEFKKEDTEEKQRLLASFKSNKRLLKQAHAEINHLKKRLKMIENKTNKEKITALYIKQVEQIYTASMFSNGYKNDLNGNYDKAIYWYKKAAEKGNVNSQINLAWMYFYGKGVAQDHHAAFNWLKKSVISGDHVAQYNLSIMYYFGQGVKQNYNQAFSWSRKSAEQGNIIAQCNLGVLYEKGHGIKQDYHQAFIWYQKSAEKGYALAQFNLGLLYNDGKGIDQDYQLASYWYDKASKQGNSDAKFNLAVLYDKGKGVKQDYQQAFNLYMSIANKGNAKAQYRVGVLYYKGMGLEKNIDKAIEWLRKSADQNMAYAQYTLGVIYYFDPGVKKNIKTAKNWFNKACSNGHKDGCYNYKILNEEGS